MRGCVQTALTTAMQAVARGALARPVAFRIALPAELDVICPKCSARRSSLRTRLLNEERWRSLKCKACGGSSSSKHWHCSCGVRWHHCAKHLQLAKASQPRNEHARTDASKTVGTRSRCDVHGPPPLIVKAFDLPMKRSLTSSPTTSKRVKLGPRLAARLPDPAA